MASFAKREDIELKFVVVAKSQPQHTTVISKNYNGRNVAVLVKVSAGAFQIKSPTLFHEIFC